MEKLSKSQTIWIAITIVLMFLNIGFILLAIPIWAVIFIQVILKKVKKSEIEQEDVPIEEGQDVDKLRALYEKAEKEKQKWIEYRKNVDLRQFNKRVNVTRQEVADYLWYHKLWEGRKEKCIILEEIMKVSNINEEDCEWILKEHYNHKGNDGSIGAGDWIRSEETRREIEYERKKAKETDKALKRIYEMDKSFRYNKDFYNKLEQSQKEIEKKRKDSKYWYIYHYEDWLKEKGYI